MKLSDELLLKSLRADVLSNVSDAHWELVCKAVDDAGDIREVRGYARTVIFDAIEKFNPYHDELGQFSSGGSGGSGGAKFTGARGGGSIPHGGTKASLERAKAKQLARTKRSQSEFLDTTDIESDMGGGAMTASDNKKAFENTLQELDDESTSILRQSMQHEDDTTAFRMSNPYRANNAKVLLANLVAAQKWSEEHKQYTGKLYSEIAKEPFLDTTDIEPDMGTGARRKKN